MTQGPSIRSLSAWPTGQTPPRTRADRSIRRHKSRSLRRVRPGPGRCKKIIAVNGYLWPGMRAGHGQVFEKVGDGFRGHRGAPIGMDHVRDTMGVEHVPDRRLGEGLRLTGVHPRPDDVPGVDVDHHVGVVVDAFDRSGEFRDVPGVDLPRPVGDQFGTLPGGVPGLPATLADLLVFAQEPGSWCRYCSTPGKRPSALPEPEHVRTVQLAPGDVLRELSCSSPHARGSYLGAHVSRSVDVNVPGRQHGRRAPCPRGRDVNVG